jgi:adenylate kinase family enzyme
MMGNVVNCFGGPGVGKSTLAARLYSELKQQHIDVEYVNEYAKELVYQENRLALKDQILVFANQYHRLWTAAQHNHVVITDSPIILSAIYNPDTSTNFRALTIEMHMRFTSINILLKRTTQAHTMTGRIHSLTESISIDNRIRALLDEQQIEYEEFDPIHDNVTPLVRLIRQEFGDEVQRELL